MAMLIRGGHVITMTEQGSLDADILISGGQIRMVGKDIPENVINGAHVLHASGLTITPGFVDLCIRSEGCEDTWLTENAMHSGVTTGLVMPEDGCNCRLLTRAGVADFPAAYIDVNGMNDNELARVLEQKHRDNRRIVCQVRDAESCRRLLDASPPSGMLLTGLDGCVSMAEEIATSGSGAVIGISHTNRSPWATAASLFEAGVPVAVSCRHPAAKLSLLRVCASLCIRDGMPRDAALASITRTPAGLLGLHDRGCIAPGCVADLAIFDGDPMLLATSLVMTIAGGWVQKKRA